MKHIFIIVATLLLGSCSKQTDNIDQPGSQRVQGTTDVATWRNQTNTRGGNGMIFTNGIISVISVNTGITSTNNFVVGNGDIINAVVKASPNEVTPFGVQRTLKTTGVLEFIPGSFRAITGGAISSYSFVIDTLYRYTVIWGTAP